MTCRAVWEAATPKCPGPVSQTGLQVAVPCLRGLFWVHAKNMWVCPKHGAVLSGEIAAERIA